MSAAGLQSANSGSGRGVILVWKKVVGGGGVERVVSGGHEGMV